MERPRSRPYDTPRRVGTLAPFGKTITAPFITIGEFVARDQVWPGGTMRETGEAAHARRPGGCRQRLSEVRDGDERTRKASVRQRRGLAPVERRRSAPRFPEHLPGARPRSLVHS